MSKMYCVYMHVSPEGLLYIGKTSRKPILRWAHGYNYFGNKDFYDVIIKHGEHDFLSVFEHFYLAADKQTWLLWDNTLSFERTNLFTSEEAEQLEKAWITILDTMNPEKGFNRTSGGDNAFSYSSIAKERMRQAQLGKCAGESNPFYGQHHSKGTKTLLSEQQSKPISMYTLDGHYLKTFPSAHEAAKEMGVTIQSISMCATKKTKTSCGMIWRYYECAQLPEYELPQKHASCKTVVQYSFQGEFIRTFDSLTEAAESANTTITRISKCVNGPHKQAGGYVWRDYVCAHIPTNELPVRQKRCRAVAQYDAQGYLIKTYHSLKEAATALGVTPEAVCSAAKGKVKTCAGYILKYL